MSSVGINETPAVVRRGSQLMVGCAVLSAVGAAAAIRAIQHLDSASTAYLELVAAVDHAAAVKLVANVHSDLLVHTAVSIAGLVLLVPLSLAVRRPWRIARTAAWISALVLSVGLAFVIATGPDALVSPNGSEAPTVRKALDGLVAGWYPGLTSVLVAVQLAATVAFSLSLARTSAGAFYARPYQDGPAGLWTFAPRPDSD